MISTEDRLILKAAAELDPSFAEKYGLGAAADYRYESFAITNYPQGVPPGDAIFVDVSAKVFDLNAGWPDAWQVVVAGAVVDDDGKPTGLRIYTAHPSSSRGSPLPYQNVIVVNDPWNITSPHTHLVLGQMGTSSISVVVQLFANHSDSPEWDWSQWHYANGPAPTNGWDLLAQLSTATPITPPSKAPNWLLIGGIAGAAFLTVAVVIVVKKK